MIGHLCRPFGCFRLSGVAVVGFLTAALLGLSVAGNTAQAAPTVRQELTLYSVPAQEQFVTNNDDRSRGEGNNPFGNYASPFATPPKEEEGNGPFAGDELLFRYELYTTPDRANRVGSAGFVCQYVFDKNATCDASYQLKDGSLIATGVFNFNANTFTLAITGGTYAYRGAKGHIHASGSPTLGGKWPQPLVTVLCRYIGCRVIDAQRLALTLQTG